MDAMEKRVAPEIPDLSDAVDAIREVEPVSILDEQRKRAHQASEHAAGLSNTFESDATERAEKEGEEAIDRRPRQR